MAITDRATAITAVTAQVDMASEPALSTADIGAAVDARLRYVPIVRSTAYVYGQVGRTVLDNGRAYKCIEAGTTGAMEPRWPTNRASRQGQQVVDGSVQFPTGVPAVPPVVWEDDGQAWPDWWDIRGAIHDLWILKASRAATFVSFSMDNQKFERDHLIDHCRRMAEVWTPYLFA